MRRPKNRHARKRDELAPRGVPSWPNKASPTKGRAHHSTAFWPLEEERDPIRCPGTVESVRQVEIGDSFWCRLLLWVQTWTREDVLLWCFVLGFAAALICNLVQNGLPLERFLALTVPFLLGRKLGQSKKAKSRTRHG